MPADKSTDGEELPVVPGAEASAEAGRDAPIGEGGAPEALGFNLRFEGGKALLSLEACDLVPGLSITRALFEVPDVDFPLDVTGGAHRFQDKRLTLRAVELTLDVRGLFDPDRLARAGLTLLRQRARAGGVEVLVSVPGAAGPVPIRARGLFVAAGEAGLAAVLHEVIPFGPAPRGRRDVAAGLLDALELPGGHPARGMVRRADVFKSVFTRLLPSFGWKVPAMGEVRVHEAALQKSGLVLRAWAGSLPDGWKKPRKQKRGPLEDAVALAVFADAVHEAKDAADRLRVVDRLVDEDSLPPTLVPFAAEVLRADDRRRAEGDDLVAEAARAHPRHLGVLSALVDERGLDDDGEARRERLLALGDAADELDEPWVASRSYLAAAERAEASDEPRAALQAAELAFEADPTLGEAGILFFRLLTSAGEHERALRVGRQAAERLEEGEAREAFLVELARLAGDVEGADAGRKLLRAALRRTDRLDALAGLLELEIRDGKLDRAAELLARLLVSGDEEKRSAAERARVRLLAADLAEARGQPEEARAHLAEARSLAPDDSAVAIRLARLWHGEGDTERALEVLLPLLDVQPVERDLAVEAARLYVARHHDDDPQRALAVLERLDEIARRSPGARRAEAEARALLGEHAPLTELVRAEAAAASTSEGRLDALLDGARQLRLSGGHEHLAQVLADALADEAGRARVAELFADEATTPAVTEATARAFREAGGEEATLRDLSERLVDAERLRSAIAVLAPCAALDDRLRRADLFRELDDLEGELAEVEHAFASLDEEQAGRRGEIAARLGALHMREGGGGPQRAVEAFFAASEAGHDVAAPWLQAALATGDPRSVGEALRSLDAEEAARGAGEVPVDVLRQLVEVDLLAGEEQAGRRLLLRRALAERTREEPDVQAYLDELKSAGDDLQAGVAHLEMAGKTGVERWADEGARLLSSTSEPDRALDALLAFLALAEDEGGAEGGAPESALELAFNLALSQGRAEDTWGLGERLLASGSGGAARQVVHQRRAAALEGQDDGRWEGALGAWLDDEPASTEALAALVPRQLQRGELDEAVARLRAAAEAGEGAGPAVRRLVRDAVAEARGRGAIDAELRALEVLLSPGELDEGDGLLLERLAETWEERGRPADAVRAWERRLDTPASDEAYAAAAGHAARLLLDPLDSPEQAAALLERRAAWAPDDLEASKALLGLLEQLEAWERLGAELERRVALLPPGPERTASRLTLGDLYAKRLDRPADAYEQWLRALRSRPFSEAAERRLLEEAGRRHDARLAVRTHVAAAKATDSAGRAARSGAEAGALLAGLLLKPRLAAACYAFAAERADEPAPIRRALVEVYRALGDGQAALRAAEDYVASLEGPARAVALEGKADILERLLDDAVSAAAVRREALEADPAHRPSALALERYLRGEGEGRAALEVRRALADGAEEPSLRAQTYSHLAAVAEDELDDAELAVELSGQALELAPHLRTLRLHRCDQLENLGRGLEAAEELGVLLADAELPVSEVVALSRRKARIELSELDDGGQARRTLSAALGRAPDNDALCHDLAGVLEAAGDPKGAATTLLSALETHEEGSEVLGSRQKVLERVAALFEDAGEDQAALDSLDEAAGLGGLGRAAELRRARLAERHGAWADAVYSLRELAGAPGTEAEEVISLLGRLAVAAERAERLPDALEAWRRRLERLPNDLQALRAVERLARELGEPEAAREAALHLLQMEDGGDEERLERLLWLARDSRDRLDDAGQAVAFLEQARAIHDEAGVRRELFLCAEAAGSPDAGLAALDAMVGAGDEVDPRDRLRRAELRLATGGEPAAALDDVILAAGALGESAAVGAVLDDVGQRAPALLGERLLQILDGGLPDEVDPGEVTRLLRGRLRLDSGLGPGLVGSLADRLPDDVELSEAAAEASEAAGDAIGAADRLIAIGQGSDDAEALDRAAAILAEADLDLGQWLPRLKVLIPALARDPHRRQAALRVLRDGEAWGPVVDLLEAGAAAAEGAERRDLRMEAVAVLRSGLDDAERAAAILEEVLADAPEDREAWGELLEALEALGDRGRLEQALARRAEGTEGIERRELVRRRSSLLLELDRGAEALPDLKAERERSPGDDDLKALERRVHEAAGGEALRAFHLEELERGAGLDDARFLLEMGGAGPDVRARAALAVLAAEPGEARSLALDTLGSPSPAPDRLEEAVQVAAGAEDVAGPEAAAAYRSALADGVAGQGSRFGLALARRLRAARVSAAELALPSVARARRLEGPAGALIELDAWGDDAIDPVTRARITLHLAPRVGDVAGFTGAVARAELDEEQADALDVTGQSAAGDMLQEQLSLAGQSRIFEAAAGPEGLLAIVRAGDVARGRGRIEQGAPEQLRAVARRAVHLRLTPERVSLRAWLQPWLDEERRAAELDRLEAMATEADDLAAAAACLDAAIELRGPDADRAARRAELAIRLGEPGAAAHCQRAADLAVSDEDAQRWRRQAVELLIKSGAEPDEVAEALRRWTLTAPDDAGVVEEALGIAEAVQADRVVDELLAELSRRADPEAALAAVRRRAAHRRSRARDAAGAVSVLLEAHERHPEAGLRDEAWWLAAGEGLADEQVDLVDDALARAGLLAALGRREEALAAAEAELAAIPRAVLRAELAALAGDEEAERSALGEVAEHEAAGPELVRRLVELAPSADEAVTRALAALDRFGPEPAMVLALARGLDEADDEVARAALAEVRRHVMLDEGQLEEGRSAEGPADEAAALLVEAWARVSARLGEEDDALAALLELARRQGDESTWAAYLRRLASLRPTEELREAFAELRDRPGLVGRAAGGAPDAFAAALHEELEGGQGSWTAEALAACREAGALEGPLQWLEVDVLVALDRLDEAAQRLYALTPSTRAGRRQQKLRIARLALERGVVAEAIASLLTLPLTAFEDDDVRAVAGDVVEAAGAVALPLLVRMASAGASDDSDIDKVMAAARAHASDPVAVAVAGWRLKQDPSDRRAWALAEARGSIPARSFFRSQVALRGSVDGAEPADLEGLDEQTRRALDLRRRSIDLEPPSSSGPSTALERARSGAREARQRAWKELAQERARRGEHLTAARLLARGGLSLADAPIEVRLAVDPDLADPRTRVDAIVEALAAPGEGGAESQARESQLLAAFSELDEQGWAGARHRAVAFRDEYDAFGSVALIDAADLGRPVALRQRLTEGGRALAPAERATLAAVASRLGEKDLARALHPGMVSEARSSASERVRAELLERAGRARDAGAPARAAGLYRLRLAAEGSSPGVELELQAVAEAAGRPDLVAESLGREAALVDDPLRRADRLAARARVRSEQLDDLAGGLADARLAASLAPEDRLLAELWGELAERAEDWGERVTALSQLEGLTRDDEERVALVLERSTLLRSRLGAPGGAVAALDSALSALGAREPLLVERARSLMQLERTFEAAEALTMAAEATAEGEERQALRREAGSLFLDSDEPERAVQAFLKGAAEGDEGALDEAERAAREAQLYPALIQVLSARLEGEDDLERRRAFALERAQITAVRLEDRERAIGLLEQQAVADETDLGARLALAQWYLDERRLLDAALAYESAAAIPGLPQVAAGPPAREAACLLSAVGDLERAGPLAEQALACGVVDLKVLAVAFAWNRGHERWEAVDEILGQEIDLIKDPRDSAHLWMDRAGIRREHLDDEPGARQALHRVLELRPDHKEALAQLRRDAEARDSFGALRAALSRAVDHADDEDQRVAWLLEIADLDDERFHDLPAAEATVDRALDLRPADPDLLVKKGVLKAKRGDVEGLPAILERAEAAGAESLPGMLQLVRGDALLLSGDREAAMVAFEAATVDDEVADRAWDRLLDLAEGLGDAGTLAEHLSRARRAAEDETRRVRLARREARLRAEAGDDDGAADAWEVVLAEEPGDTEALTALKGSYARRRKLDRLDPLFEAWARAPDEPVEKARRLGEYGAFLVDEIGSEPRGRAVLQEALEADPDEQTAVVRLGEIAFAAREWERALSLLDRVRPETWPRGPGALLFERAECAVHLGRDDATERIRAVLAEEPGHIPALELLARRGQETGDEEIYEGAIAQLAEAVDVARDPVRAAKVFTELSAAHLKHERFEDAHGAAERALELRPDASETLLAAAEAREKAGHLLEAAEGWRRLEGLLGPEEQVRCRVERARLLEAAGDEDRAHEAWRAAFALSQDPAHEERAAALAPPAPAPEAPELEAPAPMTQLGPSETLASMGGDYSLDMDVQDTAPMPAAPGPSPGPAPEPAPVGAAGSAPVLEAEQTAPGFNALEPQVRGFLDGGQPAEAVRLLREAFDTGSGDPELASLGVRAAAEADDAWALIHFTEERLKGATDKEEVQRLSLHAGRAARDKLEEYDKAADLLYLAHQTAPDDLDIRLELTELYARIPRLAKHAQTGVLQLLRRSPTDARIYRLGARLADGAGQPARRAALQGAATLLEGRIAPQELLVARPLPGPDGVTALDESELSGRLAPEGFRRPMQTLIRQISEEGEAMLISHADALTRARRLHEAQPALGPFCDAVQAVLAGRPLRVLVGPEPDVLYHPGATLHVILPEAWLAEGELVGAARLARAVGIARLGGVLAEVLTPAQLGTLITVMRVTFTGMAADDFVRGMSEQIAETLDEERMGRCMSLAKDALGQGGPDLKGWVDAVARAGDRFALFASGSLVAALAAGPIPDLLQKTGAEAAEAVRNNRRALDLCAYSARDNAWMLRREHGL